MKNYFSREVKSMLSCIGLHITSQMPMAINTISVFRTITELVKKDPSIINDEDEASNTPLHLAATEGHVKCCKELLERGAEVDARWVK